MSVNMWMLVWETQTMNIKLWIEIEKPREQEETLIWKSDNHKLKVLSSNCLKKKTWKSINFENWFLMMIEMPL